MESREKTIIRTSIIGIAANLFLAAVKAVIGLASNSIAIMLDAVISASTLAAAGIFLLFGVPLEAWLGAIISLVIIKAGLDMLKETVSKILGERNDPELAKSIKQSKDKFSPA